MTKFLVALVLISAAAQSALADAVSIDCRNTKIPYAKNIQLGNGDDMGLSGRTGADNGWDLSINGHKVNNAEVKANGSHTNVSGYTITLPDGKKVIFIYSNEEKGFVFATSASGRADHATASYCSVDVD